MKEQVVGQAEVDEAQADVDSMEARIAVAQQQINVAEQQVELRQTHLDDMVVRAPFTGVAISKDAQPGEMVSPVSAGGGFTRTGIGTIVDMASLEIEVDVNESFINRVQRRAEGRGGARRVSRLADSRARDHDIPTADRQKATVRCASASTQLDPRILPDMGVKVAFLREAARRRRRPPQAAHGRAEGRDRSTADGRPSCSWCSDDQVERRAVRVGGDGRRSGRSVRRACDAGERVVVDAARADAEGTAAT